MSSKKDIIIHAVAASSGIAMGKVFLLEHDDLNIIKKQIPLSSCNNELKRFNDALKKTRVEIKNNYKKINNALGNEYAKIADVHLLILQDPALIVDVEKMIKEGVNVEYAVYSVMGKILKSFENIKDEYFQDRKFDIQEVAKKLLNNLLKKTQKSLADIKEDSIVVAHNLSPADTVTMREKLVKGFATDIGGKTSHTAIVAQGLEIPAVSGLKDISSKVKQGDVIIVDGNKGDVIINPTQKTLNKYKKIHEKEYKEKIEFEKIKYLPAITTDNHKVEIFANIDNPNEVSSVLRNGATGIGLYRTEFMYFNRLSLPSDREHFDNYKKVVSQMKEYPTIIRTIDLGGDKIVKLENLQIPQETNPFMGLRAIRLCLKYPKIFKEQLSAILQASAYGKIKLMYPMISSLPELRQANKILQEVKNELTKNKIPFDKNIAVGTMIEVPAAVMIMDILAKEVDFVSIGTNDLIQYSLAVDRVNANVASLYEPLHPAVLRLINKIIKEAHKAKIPVAMCGEMAAEPQYTPILLGLGLDEFSVSSAQIPKIKNVIRKISYTKARQIANKALNANDGKQVKEILKKLKVN